MKVPPCVTGTAGYSAMQSLNCDDSIHFYAVRSAAHLRFKACELVIGTPLFTLAHMIQSVAELRFCEMYHVLKQGVKMWLCAFYMLYEPYEGREHFAAAERAMHHHKDFPKFLNVTDGARYLARCMQPFANFEKAQGEVAA